MSSYAHEEDQYVDFVSTDRETDKSHVDYEGKQEKVLLTRRWVEQQRVQSDGSLHRSGLTDRKDGLKHLLKSTSNPADLGNGHIRSENLESPSMHEHNIWNNPDVNEHTLLLERRLKDSENTSHSSKNHLMIGTSGSALSNRLEDTHLRKEALRLPLLPKSPLISPCGSPCASPRSSTCLGSDSSAASSPADSPSHSPRTRIAKSLPRNFIQINKQHNENLANVTRSLPGSPVTRRSLFGRASDLSESSTKRHVFRDKESIGQEKDLVHQKAEDVNGNLPFGRGIEQRSMSHGSRLHFRRPGTPATKDLKPGLRIFQYSRSMSDLGSIAEKPNQVKKKRDNCVLFPSIASRQ